MTYVLFQRARAIGDLLCLCINSSIQKHFEPLKPIRERHLFYISASNSLGIMSRNKSRKDVNVRLIVNECCCMALIKTPGVKNKKLFLSHREIDR